MKILTPTPKEISDSERMPALATVHLIPSKAHPLFRFQFFGPLSLVCVGRGLRLVRMYNLKGRTDRRTSNTPAEQVTRFLQKHLLVGGGFV
jgi:hypothetical protein